ncbi:rRNA maturation RNase YbeY [Candidatus Azambacteria bacterium RIFOXYD1_FULL_42_11]|uniref:Endoribonuclease YbeY n=4 Tax=Candidatus Azamiibacteriota TaxID=1752741 RepID=A0A0G1BJD7_9BACT|nr:MAG: putative rRNA maturation factor [Candidatus Azambacteria bacterium GW2011_GWB1_42_17]KKS46391.1 MAG: putative rRNA maturation factor [Candidatus Azambacteria bacterium GW2011_GWA1_42_19]KKS76004.1 MAG: putative rRNA maturation factor [Candidatus Azambacteria bacterium GW2011_GWA2_42_9]KKS88767.1 MAG: putative rRNA maturation factor [Parcubacteria group bacterium GW2011_GWC1_43_11]OGD43018.1 MAG: rRNA maturation RNase YbeY [Candidatus Azambacteria bacterium RIFOXYD1_FULL_42_11]
MKHEILVYNKTPQKTPKKFIENVILRALDFIKLKQPVELAVLVVSKEEIKRLNKIWRKKNEIPDELSFGLNSRSPAIGAGLARFNKNMLSLGEIVINAGKISDRNYLRAILIHSLLHLLGYDHEKSAAKARKMEQLETKILKHVA